MGLSSLLTLSADLVSLSWSALTYVPWYYLSGQSHKSLMNRRQKSVALDGEHMRRAAEHVELLRDFNGCKTMVEAMRATTSKYSSRNAMGVRELLSEEDEKQPNGRIFKKSVYGEYHWNTFADLEAEIERLAAGLAGLGLSPGSKIAFYMETRKEWFTMAHAAWRAGLTVVTVYASLGDEAVIDALTESEATVLFSSAPLLEKTGARVSASCGLSNIVYCSHENPAQTEKLDKINPDTNLIKYEDLSSDTPLSAPTVAGSDLAVIMYTSGTTGKAKGVMIQHQNLIASIAGLSSRLSISGLDFDETDVYIGYLPLAHVLELAAENVLIFNGCKIGYSSPLTLSDKSAKIKSGTMGDARALKPTLMTAVPEILERIRKAVHAQVNESSPAKKAIFNYAYEYKRKQVEIGQDAPLLNKLIFAKTRELLGGRLKAMVAGGAPVDIKTQQFMSICMSCPLVIGYGLTETCACGSVQDAYDITSGRVGPPLGSAIVKLVDWPEGNYFVKNDPPQGEICIGGPIVTAGYWKMPDKTAEDYFEEDGVRYFRTGDVGQWEADGALRIIDRKKDLCKMRHGEYIALGKIEAILKTCAAVSNIVVYGSGDILFPVAVCIPVEKTVRGWAEEEGLSSDKSFDELCQEEKIIKKMSEALLKAAKEGNLTKTEIPAKIYLDGKFESGWLPESGLVTDAFKLKRKQLNEHYKAQITTLSK